MASPTLQAEIDSFDYRAYLKLKGFSDEEIPETLSEESKRKIYARAYSQYVADEMKQVQEETPGGMSKKAALKEVEERELEQYPHRRTLFGYWDEELTADDVYKPEMLFPVLKEKYGIDVTDPYFDVEKLGDKANISINEVVRQYAPQIINDKTARNVPELEGLKRPGFIKEFQDRNAILNGDTVGAFLSEYRKKAAEEAVLEDQQQRSTSQWLSELGSAAVTQGKNMIYGYMPDLALWAAQGARIPFTNFRPLGSNASPYTVEGDTFLNKKLIELASWSGRKHAEVLKQAEKENFRPRYIESPPEYFRQGEWGKFLGSTFEQLVLNGASTVQNVLTPLTIAFGNRIITPVTTRVGSVFGPTGAAIGYGVGTALTGGAVAGLMLAGGLMTASDVTADLHEMGIHDPSKVDLYLEHVATAVALDWTSTIIEAGLLGGGKFLAAPFKNRSAIAAEKAAQDAAIRANGLNPNVVAQLAGKQLLRNQAALRQANSRIWQKAMRGAGGWAVLRRGALGAAEEGWSETHQEAINMDLVNKMTSTTQEGNWSPGAASLIWPWAWEQAKREGGYRFPEKMVKHRLETAGFIGAVMGGGLVSGGTAINEWSRAKRQAAEDRELTVTDKDGNTYIVQQAQRQRNRAARIFEDMQAKGLGINAQTIVGVGLNQVAGISVANFNGVTGTGTSATDAFIDLSRRANAGRKNIDINTLTAVNGGHEVTLNNGEKVTFLGTNSEQMLRDLVTLHNSDNHPMVINGGATIEYDPANRKPYTITRPDGTKVKAETLYDNYALYNFSTHADSALIMDTILRRTGSQSAESSIGIDITQTGTFSFTGSEQAIRDSIDNSSGRLILLDPARTKKGSTARVRKNGAIKSDTMMVLDAEDGIIYTIKMKGGKNNSNVHVNVIARDLGGKKLTLDPDVARQTIRSAADSNALRKNIRLKSPKAGITVQSEQVAGQAQWNFKVGQVEEIARLTGATVVSPAQTASNYVEFMVPGYRRNADGTMEEFGTTFSLRIDDNGKVWADTMGQSIEIEGINEYTQLVPGDTNIYAHVLQGGKYTTASINTNTGAITMRRVAPNGAEVELVLGRRGNIESYRIVSNPQRAQDMIDAAIDERNSLTSTQQATQQQMGQIVDPDLTSYTSQEIAAAGFDPMTINNILKSVLQRNIAGIIWGPLVSFNSIRDTLATQFGLPMERFMVQQLVAETGRVNGWSIRNINDEEIAFFNNDTQGLRDFKAFMTDDVINDIFALDRVAPYLLEQAMKKGTTNLTTTEYKAAIEKFLSYHDAVFRPREDTSQMIRSTERKAQIRKSLDIYIDEIEAGRVVLPNIAAVRALYGDLIQNGYGIWNPNTKKFAVDANGNRIFDTNRGRLANRITAWSYPGSTPQPLYKLGNEFYSEDELVSAAREQKNLDLLTDDVINDMVDRRIQGMQERPLDVAARGNRRYIDILNNIIFEETRKLLDQRYNSIDELMNYYGSNFTKRRRWRRMDNGEYKYIGKDNNLYTDIDIVRNPALFDVITFDENQYPHPSHILSSGNVYSEIYQLNDSFGTTLWYQETPLRDYRGKKRPQVDYDRAIYRMVQRLRMIDILMAYHNNYDVNDLINDRIIDEDNEADFPAPVRSDIEADIKQELNNAVSNAGTVMDFFDIYGPQLQQRFSIVDSSNGIFAGRTGNSTYLGVDTFLTREEVAEYINKNGLSSTQTVEAYYVFYNNDFSAIESFNTMAQADSLMNELRRPDKVDLIDITERVDERMQAEEARVGQQNARKEALRKQRAAAAAGAQQQAATGGTPTPSSAPVNYADYLTRLFGADSFVSLGAKVELYQNGLNTHHTEKLVQDTYINENLRGPDGEFDRDLTDPNKSLDRELNMTVGKLWRDAKNRGLIVIHKTINDYLNAVPRARQPILRGIFKPIVARNLKKPQTDVTLAEIDAEIATHTQDELDVIIHEKGRVQGYYDAPNKKIHLVEEAIPWTMADRVFYHELAVHCANNLTKEISDRWVQIAEYLKKHRNDDTELGRAIRAIERNRKGELRQHDVNEWGYWEEVCAYFVADYLNKIGLAARIKAVFRDWFRTTGVINKKGDITPADIIRFARASANAVVSNPKQLGTENKSGMKANDQFSMMAASFHTDADIMQEEYEAVEQHYDNAHYGDAFGMVHDRTTGIFNESNLNGFRWTLVRTPIFKKWFGDWETRGLKSSKIVDGNGEPLLVFHNTKYDEQAYDSPFIGLNGNFGQSGKSVYSNMTENPYAEKFRGNMVAQTFINMRRPLYMHNYTETSRYFEALGYEESARRLDLRKLLGSVRNDDWVRAVVTGIEDYTADPEPNTSFADFMLLNDNLILTAIPLTTMEEAHRFLNGLFEAATTPANSTLTNEPVLNANTVEEWQANLDDEETRAHWQQAADIFETRLKPYENQMLRLAYNPDGYFTHYEQAHGDLSISTREHIKDVLSAVDQRYYSFGERDMIDFRQALMDTHAEISQLPESSLSNDELFVGMVNMSMHNLRMDELHWRLGEDLDFVTSPAYPVPTAQNLLKEHNRELATSLKSAMMRDGYDGILGSEDILVMHPDQSKDVLEFKRLYQEKSYNPTQGLRENPVENRVVELLNDDIKRDAKVLGIPAVRLRSEYRSIYRAFREQNPWNESNLDEYQWILTRTPSFKENFGDWQNDVTSDMVLDTNGEPLRTAQGFVHGTGTVDVGENNYFSIAWAGSSSRFDRFSTEYVGTQTGLAVHGWGLYFTDDQLTAQSYAFPRTHFLINGITYTHHGALGRERFFRGEDGTVFNIGSGEYDAIYSLEDNSVDGALKYFQEIIDYYKSENDDYALGRKEIAQRAIDFINENTIEVRKIPGNIYKVNIPDETEMLDNTKLLSEQSDNIKDALNRILDERGEEIVNNPGVRLVVGNVDVLGMKQALNGEQDFSTSTFHRMLRAVLGSDKEVSLFLNSFDIKGTIHKNHQGKQDKRDFVVFSDEAVKILERYPFPRGIVSPATELYTPSEDEITRYFSMSNRVATEEELVNYIREAEQENPDENGYFSLGSRRSRGTWETEDVHYGPTVRPGMSETYFGLPTASVIPQEMRDNFGVRFVESAEEAERVHQQYKAAMSKQSDYVGPVYQNLLARRSVLYEDNGSYIVAPRKAVQATGNIFVISHFAPKGMKDGVRMVKNLATGPMKVIAAVPPYQGNMLRKAGFDFAGQTVQPFHGELVLKDVYTSQSVTQEEKDELFRHYTAGRSQAEMDALIAKAKRISGKKDGDSGYFSIVGRAGSRMPAANASPDPVTEYIPYERAQEFYGTGEGSMIWGPGTYVQLPIPEGVDRTNVSATSVVSAANYRRWRKSKAEYYMDFPDEIVSEQYRILTEKLNEINSKIGQLNSEEQEEIENTLSSLNMRLRSKSLYGTPTFYDDGSGDIHDMYDSEGSHYVLPKSDLTSFIFQGKEIDLSPLNFFNSLVEEFGLEEVNKAFLRLRKNRLEFVGIRSMDILRGSFDVRRGATADARIKEVTDGFVLPEGYTVKFKDFKDFVSIERDSKASERWIYFDKIFPYVKNGNLYFQLHNRDETSDLHTINRFFNISAPDTSRIFSNSFDIIRPSHRTNTFIKVNEYDEIADSFRESVMNIIDKYADMKQSLIDSRNAQEADVEQIEKKYKKKDYYGSMNLITVPSYDEMIFDPDHLGAQSMYVQERMLWLVEDYYKLGAFSDKFYNELMADLRNNTKLDNPFAEFNQYSWSTRQLLLKLGAAIAKYNGDTSRYADSNTYTKVLLDYGIKGLRYVGSHDKHAAVIFDGRDIDVVENVLPAQENLSLEEVRRVYEHVRPNEPESSEDVWDYYFSMFGREGAARLLRTSRYELEAQAEMLEAVGKDVNTILLATGYRRDRDGHWRYEVSNIEHNLQGIFTEPNRVFEYDDEFLLKDVFRAKELYAGYPELANVKVGFEEGLGEGIAYYMPYERKIYLGLHHSKKFQNPEEIRNTLLHEIQHYIQEEEGLPGGTSALTLDYNLYKKDEYKEILKYEKIINNADTPEEFEDRRKQLLPKIEALYKKLTGVENITSLSDIYDASVGENEATAVSRRSRMTQQELLRRPFELDMPVSPDNQIDTDLFTLPYFSMASRQMQLSVSPEQRRFEETIYNSNGEVQEVSNYDLGYFSISSPVAKSNWKAPDELDAEEYITLYRATVMRDGEYYSPMAEVLAGEPHPIALGEWEYSVEHPELIVVEKGKEKFKLIKKDGTPVSADYAPYIHSSLSPLNDQFTTAYRRPIVILEIQVPKSEETSGYRAEKAKKPVGWSKWKSGPVASKLGNVREVMLSRYAKPTRPLTNIEVAERIREINPELFVQGEKAIPIPINVVTPGLLRELVRLGATVGEPSGFKTQYSAQRAEKERLSRFVEDIRQNGITSPYFTDRPATGGYFSMSSAPQGLQKQADVQYPDASQEILGYFSLTEKRRARYREDLERAAQEEREGKLQLLKRVRPDLTSDFIESVLDELERYGQDADKEKMVLHWTIRGRIIPYVDRDLIDEARAIVKQKKMPIEKVLTYESPMALIDEYKRNQYRPSEEPIDPESVPEIKKDTKIDHGDGIVSYEIQDDKQGQEAMRRIVDSHFGKKWSKWCLLYANTNGLTAHSWEMWQEYSGLPKRAAFKDGRLISFMGVTRNQVGIYSIDQIIDELHNMIEEDIEDDIDTAMMKYGITEDEADLISEVSDMNDLFLEVGRFTTFIMNLGNKDYYRNNIIYFDMLIDSLASLINSNYFNENISNIRSRYPEIEDILRRFETSVPEEDTDRVDYYFRLLELENPEMIKRWKDFVNYFYTGFETTLDRKRSDVRRITDYIYYVDEDDDLAVIRDRDGELVDLRELNYNTDNEFHYQNGEFISGGNGKKEAWWDKNDDYHPNLDWARDDRTLTRIDAGLPTNDDEDLIGPDDQGLFFSMMPDLNETTNYDTDIYDRTEIAGSNGAYKLANGKVFIDVDEVGEENVARVLLYALVRESPEALNNATMRRMFANIQAWENSQDPRLRGLYADIRMDMMNDHVSDDALLSYALRRLMAEGIDPRNAQDDVSPEGVFNAIINEAPAIIGQVSGISTGKVNPTAADVLTVVNAISGVENVPIQTAVPSMGITETEMQAARTRPVPFMEAIMAEVKEIVDTYDFASFDYINGKPHLVLGGQGGLVFDLTENPLHTKNVLDQIMEKLTDFGNFDTMTGDGEMNPFKQIMEKLGTNSQLGTQATEADVNKFIGENIPDYIADRIQVVYNETQEFTDLFGDKYGGLYRPNMADRKVIYIRAYGRNLSDVINSIVYLTSGFGWTMWNNSDFAPLMDELWTVLKGNIQRDIPTYYARLDGKTPSASQKSALISAYLASKSTSIYELAEFSKTSNVAPGDEQKMRDIAKKVKDEITKVETNMAASFARDFGTNKELVEEYVEKLLRMTMAPFYGKGLWLAYDVDYDTYQANNPDASDRYKDFGHVMVFANEFGSIYKPIPLNEDAITNQIMLEKYRRMKPFWKDVHLQIWRNWHPPMKHIGDTVLGLENSIMLARAWKAVTTEWGSALKKIYQTVSSFDDTLIRKGIDTEDFDRAKGYVQELRDRGIKDKKLLDDAEIIDIFLRYGRQKMLQNVAQIRALIRTSAIEAENWMRKENVREREIQRMRMEMDQFANRFVTDWEHRSYRAYTEEGQNDLQEMYNIVNGHTPAGMPTGVGWFASVANKSQSELTQLEQDKMRGAVDEKAYAAKRRELKRNIRLYERLDALYQWTNQNVMSSLPRPTSPQYRRAQADVPRQVNDQMKQEIQNVMTLVSSEKKRGNLGKMDLIPAVRKRKLDENNPHHVLYMDFLDQVKNPAMSMLYNLDQQGKVLDKLMFNLKFGRSILETGMGTMKGSREHVNLGVDNLSWMETGTLLRYIKIDPFFLDEIAHEQELQLKIRDDVWNSYINIIKQNFTILNWRMLVSNYVGNFSNLFATGHFFRWGNYAKARAIRKDKFTSLFSNDSRKALETLKGKQALANAQAALREYDEEIAEYKEEMERLNIWGSGTTTVNLIGYGHGGVEKLSQLMSSFFESVGATDDVGSRAWNRRVNRIMDRARELYGFGDEWVKPWTYINNRAVMMAKYRAQENWAQYAGREDSPEAVDADNRIREMARRDAALLTMKETTTWELSPDVARQITSRASRVIAPDFILHGFQMARIMAVNVGRTRECAEEVARLRLKPALTEDEKIYLSLVTNELVRRTVGQAVMLWIGAEAAAYGGSILPGIVGSMLAFLRGEGDDDDEKRKKRQGRKKDEPAEMTPGDHAGLSMLCNWVSQVSDLYSPLMWVPGSVGDKFYAINFQRMNAALTFLPVRPPTNDPTILQRMMHVMLELADFRSDPLTVQIANNLRGKDRYGNDMTKSQILGEMLNYTTPQGLHQARNIALGLKDLALGTENIGWEERRKNRPLSIFDAAGIKVRQYSVNDIIENVGRTISKFESEQENPYKRKFFQQLQRNLDANQSDIASLVADIVEVNRKEMERISYAMDAFRLLRLDRQAMIKALSGSRDRGTSNLGQKEIALLLAGRDVFTERLKTNLETKIKNLEKIGEGSNMTDTERRKIRDNYRTAHRMISEALR